ncbi:monosaccharide ABC transporter substrate-binding protein, CUT2 family [Raineyella antarctica]|uniref:Monosaccharide ABC transporter substrate-binding protein, CUT2 family n=1 Tax=Raineyella antarctica TaxID=1577474 RepID=A0A1G6HQS4_9ACTN|nr:sugar ABC transporter substrate-binding protein [Raineyella antarctica]SDB96493.1 monosaccharide ABC transporter substrate-binding protein, CUT2 family [Raineyella antarctica]
MKKIGLAAALVAAAMTLTACGSGAGSAGTAGEIWYSTKNSTEQVHIAMGQGVTDAAKMLGYTGKVVVAEADAAKQNDQLNNLVQNVKPAAIVVNPYDSDSVSDVLARAKDAKIPVAVIDNKANNAQVDVSVLFDSKKSGEMAGEKAVELLTKKYGQPKGVVVDMYGEVVSQVFKERAEGFEAVIKKYPNIQLVSVLGAPQADKATSALNNVIADTKASGKSIDLVNTPTDTATLGVIESLKTNNMWQKVGTAGHVMVISHDGLGDVLQQVKDGYVDAEVVIDVLGVGGIATELLKAYPMSGNPVPTSGTFTPKGQYLNKEVTLTSGDNGPTVLLDPVVVDASSAGNPLIWGNAGK